MEHRWNENQRTRGKKPVPMPLCPPQIPHGLTRDRTRASAVRGRQQTAWAMARPRCLTQWSGMGYKVRRDAASKIFRRFRKYSGTNLRTICVCRNCLYFSIFSLPQVKFWVLFLSHTSKLFIVSLQKTTKCASLSQSVPSSNSITLTF
jgi:hypothetical protein